MVFELQIKQSNQDWRFDLRTFSYIWSWRRNVCTEHACVVILAKTKRSISSTLVSEGVDWHAEPTKRTEHRKHVFRRHPDYIGTIKKAQSLVGTMKAYTCKHGSPSSHVWPT